MKLLLLHDTPRFIFLHPLSRNAPTRLTPQRDFILSFSLFIATSRLKDLNLINHRNISLFQDCLENNFSFLPNQIVHNPAQIVAHQASYLEPPLFIIMASQKSSRERKLLWFRPHQIANPFHTCWVYPHFQNRWREDSSWIWHKIQLLDGWEGILLPKTSFVGSTSGLSFQINMETFRGIFHFHNFF